MAPAHDRRTGFSRRRQYGVFVGYVLAVAGAAIGAVLLIASAFDPPFFSGLRMGTASVTAPVSNGLAAVAGAARSVPDAIGGWIWAHRENAAMRRELEVSRPLLMRARVLANDNRRLRALLRFQDRAAQPVVSARLVSSSASSGRRFALLAAGRLHGVLPGMPVRAPDGLVGRVTETGPNAARVLLLTDPTSIVPVRRTRDGLPAIAVGRGDGMVDVRSVNATDVAFRAGEVFVTSGTGGLYAPGIPVARIVRDGADTVIARTFAQPDAFDFALVERAFVSLPPPPPGPAAQAQP